MSQHTPGPWAVDDDLPEIYSTVDQHSRGYLAVVRGKDSRNKPLPADEVRANARLIAAAPELLRELKFAVSVLQDNHIARGVAAALAAIRQAEGSGE
jgi:hypothetical protein